MDYCIISSVCVYKKSLLSLLDCVFIQGQLCQEENWFSTGSDHSLARSQVPGHHQGPPLMVMLQKGLVVVEESPLMVLLLNKQVVDEVVEFPLVVFSSPYFAWEEQLIVVCCLLVAVECLRLLLTMLRLGRLDLGMKIEMIEVEELETIWKVLQKKLQWSMLTELMLEVDLELWTWLCAFWEEACCLHLGRAH